MKNLKIEVPILKLRVQRAKRILLRSLVFGLWSWVFIFGLCAEEVNRVVAMVNNQVITAKDLDDYCKMFFYPGLDSEDDLKCDSKESQKNALDKLIIDKLILDKAKNDKIDVPLAVIDKKLGQIISSYNTFDEFEQSLIEHGLNLTILKERIKEQFMLRAAIEKYTQMQIKVSPQEVSNYYQAHKEDFISFAKYILWMLKSADTKLLSDVSQKIKADGFLKTKDEYEKSFTRMEAAIDDLRQEISSSIGSLEEGNFFIKEMDGIGHLIYLEKKVPRSNLSLEEVEEKVYNYLWNNKFQVRLNEWMNELKKDATIKIYL